MNRDFFILNIETIIEDLCGNIFSVDYIGYNKLP